jgi:ribose-phosphate pyrophosphokinase
MNDLIFLGVVLHSLKTKNISSVQVILPYIPGVKNYNAKDTESPITLKVITQIINTFPYDELITLDTVSPVATALLKNCINITNHSFVYNIVSNFNEPITLVCPNSHLVDKLTKLQEYLEAQSNLEMNNLVLCTQTLQDSVNNTYKTKIFTEELQNQTCVVVADVGVTLESFIDLAKQLLKKNANKLFLIITHGIFTENITELTKYYDKIYFSNSRDIKSTNCEIINFEY